MCGKFHTPLQIGRVKVIISCQKVVNKLFLKKNRLTKTALAAKHANFFSNGFWFWLDERSNNITDRQTDKFFDTIYGGMCIFSFS